MLRGNLRGTFLLFGNCSAICGSISDVRDETSATISKKPGSYFRNIKILHDLNQELLVQVSKYVCIIIHFSEGLLYSMTGSNIMFVVTLGKIICYPLCKYDNHNID